MEIDRHTPAQPDLRRPRRAYTTADLKQAGWCNTDGTARAWARQGLLPAIKSPNGRGWLFDADAVDRIWNRNERTTPSG
jgi:hypothetical protein